MVRRSVSIDIINFDGDGDGHGTCKQALTSPFFVSGTFDIFEVVCVKRIVKPCSHLTFASEEPVPRSLTQTQS